MQSEYMYWAKHQPTAAYPLGSSEVPATRLDRLPITLHDLELDGRSRYRYPPLREAIAWHTGVAPECVVMADGTSMANMLALATLIAPGDAVVAEWPAYEPMVAAARFLGAQVRSFRRREPAFTIDLVAVEAAVTPSTRAILLTNLHNPSGNLADEPTLRAIGAIAERVGARVLVDEVYLDAAQPPQRTAALLGPTFVATSSLTKCHGLSGLRCGWTLAEPDLAERMWRLNELFGVAQSHPTERLACIAFEHLTDLTADNAALLARNRALANTFFAGRNDTEWTPMTRGITAFPRLRHGDVDALHRLLLDRFETSIVPGRFFGAPDRFRVGVGSPTAILGEGLDRLGRALDALR